MTTDIQKFWSKINKEHQSGCWIWVGSKLKDGYGQTRFNGKQQRVHRVVYTLVKGEIPKGLVVCHKCDVRACCNPEHLFLGTIADNNKDAQNKGRSFVDFHFKGEKHPSAKLTDSQYQEIKQLNASGKSYREIGRTFNISHVRVYKICKGIQR